jgi:hypothetical protein
MLSKEVIKQGNAIHLYYLNFLGTVMLRPVLVTFDGGAGGDSSPFTPLAPPVHLSTRFLLGTCFFEVIAWVVWDCCAISLNLLLFPLGYFLSLLFLLLLPFLLEFLSLHTLLFKLKLLLNFVILLLLLPPCFLEFFFSLCLLKK